MWLGAQPTKTALSNQALKYSPLLFPNQQTSTAADELLAYVQLNQASDLALNRKKKEEGIAGCTCLQLIASLFYYFSRQITVRVFLVPPPWCCLLCIPNVSRN